VEGRRGGVNVVVVEPKADMAPGLREAGALVGEPLRTAEGLAHRRRGRRVIER
jgi:hypothetical protein